MQGLIEVLGDRDFSINVISKSGTTTEPAIAFRIFKEIIEKKYGKEEAAKRIYATTDKARGALKTLATEEGYETFVVPDDVGGRFSVLTAVGLLPIAVSVIFPLDVAALNAKFHLLAVGTVRAGNIGEVNQRPPCVIALANIAPKDAAAVIFSSTSRPSSPSSPFRSKGHQVFQSVSAPVVYRH